MAHVFISFSTLDTTRVQSICDALNASGLSTFWSNDIPPGSPSYLDVIIDEMRNAAVVLVLWTRTSVKSPAVAQECSQATRDGKLFQAVLDEIEPIRFPMEAGFTAQKSNLIGWNGDVTARDWVKLCEAITRRVTDQNSARPDEQSEKQKDPIWEAAKEEDSIEGYKRYLQECPEGEFVDVARLILERFGDLEASWHQVKTSSEAEQFLSEWWHWLSDSKRKEIEEEIKDFEACESESEQEKFEEEMDIKHYGRRMDVP
jgi:hypothetical protein